MDQPNKALAAPSPAQAAPPDEAVALAVRLASLRAEIAAVEHRLQAVRGQPAGESCATSGGVDEGEFRRILLDAPIPIIVYDDAGRVLHVNREWTRVTGYSPEQLPTLEAWLRLAYRERADEILALSKRLWGTDETFRGIFTYWAGDGCQRVLNITSRPLTVLADGRRLRITVAADVTEQRRTEEQLRESRNVLRAALDAGEMGAWEWDVTTNEITWDDRQRSLWGLTPQTSDTSLAAVMNAIHKDDQAYMWAKLTEASQQGKSYSTEFRIRRPDGSERWLAARGRPLLDATGKVIRVVGVNFDITDRKQQEIEIHESEARFRRIADTMPQMVWTTRPDGSHEYFNRQWYRYSGFTDAEGLGYGWQKALHPDDVPRTQRRWQKSLQSGEPYEIEYRLRRADGVYRWHLGRAEAVRDASGRIQQWYGTCTDIDDLKRAEDELRSAIADAERARDEADTARREVERVSAAKDEFLAKLSHELRTPLTPVLTIAQLLENDAGLSDDVREQVGTVRRNVQLECRLIDDLLDLTRIARGKIELQRRHIDLSDLVERVLGMCDAEILSKRLRVCFHKPAGALVVDGDAARLQQALWNLIKNAVKFTNEAGRVEIAARHCSDGTAEVVVTDNGVGIDQNRLSRIFDAFEQGGPDVTRRFGGLGLGLAIARSVAELHGGTVVARSDGRGRGATFTLRLPAASPGAAPTPVPTSEPASSSTRAKGYRVLLVEDHADTGRVMVRVLRSIGHQVVLTGTVADAVRAAEQQLPEVLLSDIGLPDGSGLDLMRQLRALPGGEGIYACALSGFGTEQDILRSREAGFDAHLIKPVELDQLRKLFEQVAK